ncbi:MAG: phosphomannomutase/phosphoglucomutase [Gammaproteobacteria bacterium]|nr:phosphomannomutase/phosphoglucomutase [Gammaproteobacteria bacterium]
MNKQVPAEIFKAYDIRGIVGKTLDKDIAYQIGRAFGSEAIEAGMKVVVIGRDGRISGPDMAEALTGGLMDSGCRVMDIGMVPTPVLYFATHHLGTQTGISITGSHNPTDYNGFKMVIAGETLAQERIQLLRQRIENQDFTSGKGMLLQADVRDAYLDRILGDIKLARPLSIAVDCGNGVAGEWAPILFEKLGCDITRLYCDVDGTFPNHHPDPSQARNLEDVISIVKQANLDLGLAFDGDGDRVGVVTRNGDIIWPDRIMQLFAQDVLSRNPGGEIIYDVKCSRKLHEAIEKSGGKATMWKTGHSLIKAKLKETGALLAGEMSGHIFFKERWYGFDDAMYAAARLLEILSQQDRPPAEVFAALPDTVNTPELQIAFEEGEHHKAIEELVAAADFSDARVSTIDGLRVDFEDGFGLVRASNTTPVWVLRFEADNDAALARIQERFSRLIKQIRPEARLPY